MGFIPDDQFYLPEEKKIDTAAGGPQTPPVKLIKDDDFYAVPKDSMPSLGTATLYGAARNIVPSIAGLISGTVSGIAGGVAGGPAAAYTAPVAAFAGSTAGAYGTAKAQEAIWKPGLREQLAAADSPNAYSWAGLIPGFATGKFIDPKALATGGLKAGANAAQVATANAVKKAARIELATEVGGELGGDLVINALTGQEQNVGQSVGMALTEGLLQGQQTRLGRSIAQSPINLAQYLTTPSAPKPATPVTPGIQSDMLAEARGAGAVDPNAPIPLGPDGLPVATQGQIAAQNVPAATVATPAVATPAVATPAVATPAVATPAVATPAAATPATAATPAAPAAPVARPSVQPGTTAAVTVAADGRGQVTSIPDHIPAHETLPLEQLRAAHGAMEPAQAANSIIGLNAEAHRRNGSNKPADPAFVERILTHTGVALRDIATKDQGLAISTGEGVSRMLEKQILNARNNPDQTPYTPEQVFEMEYRKGRIDAIVDHIRKGGREPLAYSVAGAAEYVKNMKHYAGKDAEVEAARNTPPTPEQVQAESEVDIQEVPVKFSTRKFVPNPDKTRTDGTSVLEDGEAPIVEYTAPGNPGRLMVIRNINGVQVPFYLSTGSAGKKDVPAGKWYPFFGIKDSWINKTGGQDMANYQNRKELAAVARQLDRTIGDIRHKADRDLFPKIGNRESIVHVNQGFDPAGSGDADTRDKVNANIKNLFDRLDAAAAQRKPKPVAAQTAQEAQNGEGDSKDFPDPVGDGAQKVFKDSLSNDIIEGALIKNEVPIVSKLDENTAKQLLKLFKKMATGNLADGSPSQLGYATNLANIRKLEAHLAKLASANAKPTPKPVEAPKPKQRPTQYDSSELQAEKPDLVKSFKEMIESNLDHQKKKPKLYPEPSAEMAAKNIAAGAHNSADIIPKFSEDPQGHHEAMLALKKAAGLPEDYQFTSYGRYNHANDFKARNDTRHWKPSDPLGAEKPSDVKERERLFAEDAEKSKEEEGSEATGRPKDDNVTLADVRNPYVLAPVPGAIPEGQLVDKPTKIKFNTKDKKNRPQYGDMITWFTMGTPSMDDMINGIKATLPDGTIVPFTGTIEGQPGRYDKVAFAVIGIKKNKWYIEWGQAPKNSYAVERMAASDGAVIVFDPNNNRYYRMRGDVKGEKQEDIAKVRHLMQSDVLTPEDIKKIDQERRKVVKHSDADTKLLKEIEKHADDIEEMDADGDLEAVDIEKEAARQTASGLSTKAAIAEAEALLGFKLTQKPAKESQKPKKKNAAPQTEEEKAWSELSRKQSDEDEALMKENEDARQEVEDIREKSKKAYANGDRKNGDKLDDLADEKEDAIDKKEQVVNERQLKERLALLGEDEKFTPEYDEHGSIINIPKGDGKGDLPGEVRDDKKGEEKLQKIHDYLTRLSIKHDKKAGRHNRGQTFREFVDESATHHDPINGLTNEGYRVGDIVEHEGYLQIISHAAHNELNLEAIWPFDSIGAGGWGTDSSELKPTGKNIFSDPNIDPAKLAKEMKIQPRMPYHEKDQINNIKKFELEKVDAALKKASGESKKMLEEHKEIILEKIAKIQKRADEIMNRENRGIATDKEIADLDSITLLEKRNSLLNDVNRINKEIEDGHSSGAYKQEDNEDAAYEDYVALRRRELDLSDVEDQIKVMQDDGSWSGGNLVSHDEYKKAWSSEVMPEAIAKQIDSLYEAKIKLKQSLEKAQYKGMRPKDIFAKIESIDSQIQKLSTNTKTGRKYRNADGNREADSYSSEWASSLSNSPAARGTQEDKPKQLGAGVQKGELFDSSDDFSLAGETAAQPPIARTEDTTGDFSTGAEPVHIVDARQQLSKLEKAGRNPDQQEALRRTIKEYDAQVAKPDVSKMDGEQLFAELDKMGERKFAGGMADMNRIIDRIEQMYPGSKERIISRARDQQNDDSAGAIDMYVRSELNSRMRGDRNASQSEPKPSFDPAGFREVVNDDEVAMGILDHDDVLKGRGKDNMLRPTAEIAEEMNVGIPNVSRLYKQLVKEKLVEAFKGRKVKTANGSYTTTYMLAKGVDYKTLQARLKKLANGLDAPLKDLMAALKADVDDTTSKIHPSHGPLYALTEQGHTPSILKRIIKLGGTFDDIVKLFNIDVAKESAADNRWKDGDHRINNLRRMFAGKEPVNRTRRESIEREEAARAAAAAPVQAKRTELKGLKGFQRGIQDMRELLADAQNDDVRKHRQANVEKMEAILSATRPKTADSGRIETQRKKLKALLDGTAFGANRASGLAFAENPDVIEIMDRIKSYQGLQVTSATDAEAVLKPAAEGEPASITEARQQLSRIIKNMSRGEGWDAKKAEAQAKIEQFELENKLLSGKHEPTQEELDIISNAALEEFVSKFGSGDVDPAITTKVENELTARFQLQEEAGVKETGEDETPYGDLLADIKGLMAEHGDKYGIPTLPAVFEAESLNTLREQLSPQQARELMRHPKGMGAVDANRAKNDRTYRIEMRNQAEGQISQLATALSELGWTQFDPTTTNSDELIQAIVAAGRGELQTPKGGVLGAAAKIDKRAQGIVDRLYQADQANPDDPFSRRDLSPEASKRELDRRKAQNAKNREGDPETRKGYQGIVSRITDELRLRGELSPKEIEGVTRILNKIGAQFFEGVKMKIGAGSRPGEYGQYQTIDRIVTIFKDAIRNGSFEETAAHEIAHHLARFLPEADRIAVIKEMQAKRTEFLKDHKGLETLFGATENKDWAKKRFNAQQVAAANLSNPTEVLVKLDSEELKKEGFKPGQSVYRLKLTDETYRLTNPNEYFAEEFKDNVMRELRSDPVYLGRSRNWKEKLSGLWETIKINFRKMFGKEIANKILSNFAKGRYNPENEGGATIEGAGSDRTWDTGTVLNKNDRKLKADRVVIGPDNDANSLYPIGEQFDRPEQGPADPDGTLVANILGKNKMSPERAEQIKEFVKNSAVKHALYRGQNNAYETLDANSSTDGLFHLAGDPDYAVQYAQDFNKRLPKPGTSGAVIQVYINAKNIVDISKIGHSIDSRANIEKMRKLDADGLTANEHIAAREDEFINKIISEVQRINAGKDLDLTELREGLYEAFDEAREDMLNRLQTSVWQVFSHSSIHSLFHKYGVDAIKYSDSDLRTAQGGKKGGKDSYVLADPRKIKAAFGENDVNPSSSNIFQNKREPKQGELDMRVSGEVRLQDAMGVKDKNKLSEADFERLTAEDPSFNPREWQSVLEEGHFDSKGPDARLIGKRVYKRIALPGMVDPSAEATAQDSLPKNDVSNSGDGQTLSMVRDASKDQSDDPEVFKNPRPGQSVARTAWDIVSGRYLSGISGKAHQNAARHPDSEAVKAIANMIHSRPGTQSNSYERDIPTAISVARTKYQTKLNKIMEPLRATLGAFKDTEDGTAKAQREEIYQALTDMITGRKPFTAGAIGDTARGLKALLADLHEHRKEAGEALGEVENYFPAVYDSPRIGESRKPFINDAKAAYEIELSKLDEQELARELGITKAELADLSENDPQKLEDDIAALAENKALALYNSHVRGASADEFDSIFGMSNKGGAENPSLNRKFGREAQDIMRKWQVNDPFRVVGRYITSGIKRAELVRRFGNEGEKWSKLSHQMEKDGVPYEVISEMRELTRTAVGVGFPNPGKAAQTFVDSVTLMTAASAMGRGFLNNLVEPVTMGMRTGSPIDILRAYAETWTRFLREIPALSSTLRAKMGETFWSEYGHEIGTIHNSIEDAWMTTHSMDLDGEYADPRFRWLTNRIYKANLMDASETAKQQASHALGFSFINKLGSMARGDHWTNSLGLNSKQSVADQLSELGIKPEDQAEFADWTKKLDAAKIDVRKAMMLGSDKMAKLHQEAMVRFSLQSSVRSNRAHKPEFQDSALGKTYLQLMNFSYSYAAEVNSRMYNMTKQAFAFSPDGKNYSMYDRMRMLGPVAGGMLSILAYRGLLELKDLLYPSESSEKRKKDPEIVKWLNATSYAGLLGPKFEQAMKSIKRDQAIGGPVGQMSVNVARAGKSVFEAAAEGKDMSSAKKSIAKASVPVLKGGIVAGSSAIHPALGTVAAQATNAPAFTNAIVPQDGKKQGGGLTPDTFRLK